MEDDKKKKKKNKKKKNKQADATDNALVAGNGQVSIDVAATDGGSDDVQVAGNVQGEDVNRNSQESNGTQCNLFAESEKQQWLQREAALEDTIKQLQKEKDLHFQKEATLEDTVTQLQNENDSYRQKEATSEETIEQLRNENESHLQKEAGLQKEVVQLLSEKDSWLQKEVGLEEKISLLVAEKDTMDSKEARTHVPFASLQDMIERLERDGDAWILKEDSFKERIETLNGDISRLRTQVLELEQSRNNLVHENRQLMENTSSLLLQIKNLESVSYTPSSDELAKYASEREDLNSQIEEAYALVGKLMADNAELIEKVNDLYVELDQRSATVELISTKASNTTVVPPETASVVDPMSRSNEDVSTSDQNPEVVPLKQEMHSNGNADMYTSDQKPDSEEAAPIKLEMHSNGNVDPQHVALVPELAVSDEINEIVQIPLDEIHESEVQNLVSSVEDDKNAAVPLIDAPLIGAPFRLMSFVARYVSGADLVNKAPTNSSL